MIILNKTLIALVLYSVALMGGCSTPKEEKTPPVTIGSTPKEEKTPPVTIGSTPKEEKTPPVTIESKPFRFYIVLSPINEKQAKLAQLFLLNAEITNPDSEANAQIIRPINFYTIAELCNDDSIAFPTSDQKVSSDLDIAAVVKKPKDSIQEKLNGSPCQSTPKVLTSIVGNLKDASKRGEKLVVIMQVPWSSKEISSSTFADFKKGLEEVAQSNNIEKVMLFGVSPEGSDRLNSAFEAFNQNGKRFMGSTNEPSQMLQKMKEIRSEVLESK